MRIYFPLTGCLVLLTLMAVTEVRAGETDEETALLAVIKEEPGSDKAVRALQTLCGDYRSTGRQDDALTLLADVRRTETGLPLDAAARCLSVPILIKQERPDAARDICLTVLEDFKGTGWAAQALYDLGELFLHVYGDRSAAAEYFRQLTEEYPQSGLAADAALYLENWKK